MAAELIACALLRSPALVVLALALGGFGNGAALVHDRLLLASSAPESLHGRLFSLQRMCIAGAFALSFVGAGALITALGVRSTLLLAGIGLALVASAAVPTPAQGLANPALRPGHPARRRASLGARGEIAQLVEHTTENRGVPGSSPGLATPKGPASGPFSLLG